MVLDGVLVEPEITWLGLARDKVATFTVPGTPPPGAFTLTAPASGATNQPTSVTLSWGTSSGAASYAYCLDTTLNGACNGTWPSVGAATSATVSGLTGGATYEWQVRATNATGTTDATGAWRTFTVAAAAPLVKTSPASGTTGLGSPVIVTWASTLTNVAYTVCWDQAPDGACSGVWWPNGQSLVTWLENLAPGTYYWPFDRVRHVRSGPPRAMEANATESRGGQSGRRRRRGMSMRMARTRTGRSRWGAHSRRRLSRRAARAPQRVAAA